MNRVQPATLRKSSPGTQPTSHGGPPPDRSRVKRGGYSRYPPIMLLTITSLPGNERGPRHMDAVWRALHAANPKRLPLLIGYRSTADALLLQADIPDSLRNAALEHLQDAYPDCLVKVMAKEKEKARDEEQQDTKPSWSLPILLTPDIYALRDNSQFESTFESETVDPITGLLAALRTGSGGSATHELRLSVRPASRSRLRQSRRVLTISRRTFANDVFRDLAVKWGSRGGYHQRFAAWLVTRITSKNETPKNAVSNPMDDKTQQPVFECVINYRANGCDRRTAQRQIQRVLGALNAFADGQSQFVAVGRLRRGQHSRKRFPNSLLSAAELALLVHPPRNVLRSAKLQAANCRELEPPPSLPTPRTHGDVTRIGRVRFRGQRPQFGIRADDLRRHLFVCGRTGTGKSTLIRSMALDAITAGRTVCVIDPHGDLVEGLLDRIPKSRTNDVVYFNAADRTQPVAFNPLACNDVWQRPLIADGLVVSLKKIYGDSWGPRLEQLLRNSVLALLEQPGSTLLSIRELLQSRAFRNQVMTKVSDPVVRSFWIDTFGNWPERLRQEAISPVTNKLDALLANSIARNIICQPRSTIDIRAIIDRPGSIFLCNLSKGLVGEQTSNLLGALLVAGLQTAALARADRPESSRNDVQIYVDEFHSFVSDQNSSFATILSESRKYRVSFAALATQFLDQIDEATLSSVLGNCGSSIVFRAGVRDAEILAEHLGGVTPDDIVNLPNYTAYAKLLTDGQPSRHPFSMTTEPDGSSDGRAEIVREVSRRKYGRHVATAGSSSSRPSLSPVARA